MPVPPSSETSPVSFTAQTRNLCWSRSLATAMSTGPDGDANAYSTSTLFGRSSGAITCLTEPSSA
jgi:hypothetical protein